MFEIQTKSQSTMFKLWRSKHKMILKYVGLYPLSKRICTVKLHWFVGELLLALIFSYPSQGKPLLLHQGLPLSISSCVEKLAFDTKSRERLSQSRIRQNACQALSVGYLPENIPDWSQLRAR